MFVTNGYGPAGGPALGFPGVSRAPVKLASVTDGSSNTVAFSEIAHGLLSTTDGNPSSFDNRIGRSYAGRLTPRGRVK